MPSIFTTFCIYSILWGVLIMFIEILIILLVKIFKENKFKPKNNSMLYSVSTYLILNYI